MNYGSVLAGVLISGVLSVYLGVYLFSHSPRQPKSSELKYRTNAYTDEWFELPNAMDPESTYKDNGIELTVVIPCYNETKRLGVMFEDCLKYLRSHHRYQYEIIIVDDKSSDGTSDYAIQLANEYDLKPHVLKVIQFEKNRGKGGAVTQGILHASGKYILFADADGATKFSDCEKLLEYLQSLGTEQPGIAIGSRSHMVNTDAVVKRSFIRNFLMYGLHTLVYIFGIRQVQDTQCGFKMFNYNAAKAIFPHMHTERWIFDVEILLIASLQKMAMKEIPVNWQEIDGSKIDLARDSIGMAIDLVVTRLAYILGIYKLNQSGKSKIA